VSSTLAIQELRKSPKKAEERIVAAVAKAKSQGKTKATRKHVENSVKMQTVRENVSIATGDSIKDVLKAMAAKVREIVGHDGDDVLTTDGTLTVVIQVPAPEPAPKRLRLLLKAAPAKKAAAKPAKGAAKARRLRSRQSPPRLLRRLLRLLRPMTKARRCLARRRQPFLPLIRTIRTTFNQRADATGRREIVAPSFL
jgi:hypothetical protein